MNTLYDYGFIDFVSLVQNFLIYQCYAVVLCPNIFSLCLEKYFNPIYFNEGFVDVTFPDANV
jgi:hypothetical protein